MDAEATAMNKIAEALNEVDELARTRLLRWACDRYQVSGGNAPKVASNQSNAIAEVQHESYSDLASFYDAANAESQSEKALVVGYWLQVLNANEDWESQSVNSELKNLGHGIGNITDALNTLIEQSPRLVIQTRKSGTTKQARKRYKLTTEGIKKVKNMLSRARGSGDDE